MNPGERSREWVKRLPTVIAALNGEMTRLTGNRPRDAIKSRFVARKPFLPASRPVDLHEQKLPSVVGVSYLYQSGELEGSRRHATVWSRQVYRLGRSLTKPGEPLLYYLWGNDAPQQGFVCEELLVVPPDTQLPPDRVLSP